MIPILGGLMLFCGDETSSIFETVVQDGKGYNYLSEFVNMMLVLLLIVALIFATIYLLKRMMKARAQSSYRTSSIRILERRSLGPKSALYLVDILGKGVVISESASGIQLIKEFSDEIEITELMEQMLEEPEPRASLKERIASKLNLRQATRV